MYVVTQFFDKGVFIVQLAAHEAHDLHELAISCVNSITNMAYFLQHVQDAELKGIIERHFPLLFKITI